jgi:hypothetical protein
MLAGKSFWAARRKSGFVRHNPCRVAAGKLNAYSARARSKKRDQTVTLMFDPSFPDYLGEIKQCRAPWQCHGYYIPLFKPGRIGIGPVVTFATGEPERARHENAPSNVVA